MADIKITVMTMAVKAIEHHEVIRKTKRLPRVIDAAHRGAKVLNGYVLPFSPAE